MNKGKITCDVLKEIRKQIASENKIEYHTHECTFEGECRGTCPACESEVQYLENEIVKRKYLGKAVVVAGLSIGLISGLTGCGEQNHTNSKEKESKEKQQNVIEKNDTLTFQQIVPNQKSKNDLVVPDIMNIVGDISPDIFLDTMQNIEPNNNGMEGIIDNIIDTSSFRLVDQMPEFPGGIDSFYQYLSKVITYPEIGTIDVNGIVLIEFVIEKDGSISNVIAKQKLYPEFDAEAIRVIQNSPKWIPGKQLGKPVRVLYQIPIKFYIK